MKGNDMETKVITSRIGLEQFAIIEKASVQSGRSISAIIERLIMLIDTPQGRAVLGIVEDTKVEYAWKKE
jgi:hypothetical protein